MREVGWSGATGVGVGLAGLVLPGDGVLVESPNLMAWNGGRVAEGLRERLGIPVRIENDANAFALAEWLWGAGRGATDAVFLTLGTGVGGGLVAGRQLVRGRPGFASEPGHLRIAPRGVRLPSGTAGEAEWFLGNRAIVDRARRHPGFAADALLSRGAPLTPERLSEAAEAGSQTAREVWREVGAALGELLVTLVNLLNTERIVVGGGVAQAGDRLLDPARDYLAAHSLIARHAPPALVPAALGTDAGVLGAAGLWLERGVDSRNG